MKTAATALSATEIKSAKTIALSASDAASITSIVQALPEPRQLTPGTLVIVAPEVAGARSLTRSVLAVFGRTKTVRRSDRCTALVLRGYDRVGARDDDNDFAWGYAPPQASSNY